MFTLASKVICNDIGLKKLEEMVCKDFAGIGPYLTDLHFPIDEGVDFCHLLQSPSPLLRHQSLIIEGPVLYPSAQSPPRGIASFICVATRYSVACLICVTLDRKNGTQRLC